MIVQKNISLVMYGIKKCSGGCVYCSAASTMGYRDTKNGNRKTFKLDVEKTKQRIKEYTEIEQVLKNGDAAELHIDIWGGNPLENFEEFKKTVEFCQNELKEFSQVFLHTSGNGLELQSNDLVEYLIDNDIHYQLSHDGLGQWMRTGEIDPLYWDKTKDNIVKLARLGILDWVNTTLNNRNYSLFANMEFWNKWRSENNLMDKNIYIKLNHIYEGTPPIEKPWYGKDIVPTTAGVSPCKHGEIIGDLNFTGQNLINYMHEFRKMAIICSTPGIENSPEWAPFVSYIMNEVGRWRVLNSEEEAGCNCRLFQMGLIDRLFAIDTTGEYCQCNLIDSSSTVKNPSGKRPKKCETCVYKLQDFCLPCGSETARETCEFSYQFCQVMEEYQQMMSVIQTICNLNDNNCNCNGDCNCNGECNNQKDREPVYCVKNYTL